MGSIDWGVMWYAAPYMAKGAVVTLEICSLAMIAGRIIGVICGLLSLSEVVILKAIVRSYVYFVRGTPALVQMFLVYFALPAIGIDIRPSGAGWRPSPSMPAASSRRSFGRACNRSMPARARPPPRSA